VGDGVARPDLEALVRLAASIQSVCVASGVTVATAESCTGGLVAHAITEIEGSSGHFVGGIVAYSNDVKEARLGVPAEMLRSHGAVSAQVARAMADGARSALQSDFGVAVTGIAGPDGGTDAKPVGLTYVAVAGPAGAEVRRYVWLGDRHANKLASAEAALTLLLEAAQRPRG
jgi:PncC family amidohydrolase